jgi:hypothetical protein
MTQTMVLSLYGKADSTIVYCQCCCLLGKEIGFADNALDSYIRLKEIHSFSSIDVRLVDCYSNIAGILSYKSSLYLVAGNKRKQ